MSVSLNIGITAANGKKSTKAFTDVSPYASNSDMLQFANAINDITTNSITSINKITKEDIDFTYTPITVARYPNVTDGLPVTISGNSITVTRASVVEENYYITHDTDEVGLWSHIALTFSAGDIAINGLVVPSITQPINASQDLVALNGRRPDCVEISFIIDKTGTNSFSFDFIIPAGSSGSTAWETTTFTVNFT